MSANKARGIFLPRRGTRVSTIKSSQVVRNMVADTWRWLWPDTLMRVIPLAAIPFLYVAIFHLPLAFLGLTLHNWPQQLIIGLVFSFLYLAQPEPRSLLAVVIVHGFTTWGFLSLGDEVMYRRWKRKQA